MYGMEYQEGGYGARGCLLKEICSSVLLHIGGKIWERDRFSKTSRRNERVYGSSRSSILLICKIARRLHTSANAPATCHYSREISSHFPRNYTVNLAS